MSSVRSSVCGHSSCSYMLDVMNDAATSIHVWFLCGRTFSLSLGVYLAVELLGHVLTQCQTVFAKKLPHFTSSPATYEGSNFSASSTTLVIICLFDYSSYSLLPTILHGAWNMARSQTFHEQITNGSLTTACLQFSWVCYRCTHYD